MHHKRKKTSTRKEGKRLEHKSIRMRERQAINGGRVQEPRKDRWGGSPATIPIVYDDQEKHGTAGSKSKRVRKPKERCPENGKHEWYSEVVVDHGEDVTGAPGFRSCEDCRKLQIGQSWDYYYPFYTRRYCPEHKIVRKYTETYTLRTCIGCWTTKKTPRYPRRDYEDGGERYGWRSQRKLKLKKRPIVLY